MAPGKLKKEIAQAGIDDPKKIAENECPTWPEVGQDDGEDAPSGDLTMTIIQYMIHLPMGKFPWLC